MGVFVDRWPWRLPRPYWLVQTESEVLLTDSNLTLNVTDSWTLNGHKIEGDCYCNSLLIGKLLDNLNFA